ncbi:MAG: pyridoxal-phosphate dependent enzyme, partial [Crocinitomicaceae bacterium]|nr:pyridoxal-phosphate dependent enzyme [Crocinitomicaceae bacterium]
MLLKTESYTKPDDLGFYGEFGGAFIPELLRPNVEELDQVFMKCLSDEQFQKEYIQILKDYVGRPTPLYHSEKLSEKYGGTIYLKREDLNHTGAHKINNAIG